jgi:hypothetical protein
MGSATVDEILIRSYLSTAAEYGKHFYDALVQLAERHPWLPTIQSADQLRFFIAPDVAIPHRPRGGAGQ